jgi:hypothetical protein
MSFIARNPLTGPVAALLLVVIVLCPLWLLSAVSQNRPLVVEIKGFKTSHF